MAGVNLRLEAGSIRLVSWLACDCSWLLCFLCIASFTGIELQRCVWSYPGLDCFEPSNIIVVGLRYSCKQILSVSSVGV